MLSVERGDTAAKNDKFQLQPFPLYLLKLRIDVLHDVLLGSRCIDTSFNMVTAHSNHLLW
jgi:hypothetical protein